MARAIADRIRLSAGTGRLSASCAVIGAFLAAAISVAPAHAQCEPFRYDFNTLTPGSIEGQDGWVRRAPPNNAGSIAEGAGIDGSRAHRTTTDRSGSQGASRQLPHPFRYSASSGTTLWSLVAKLSSNGSPGNRDAHAGLMFHDQAEQMRPLVTFGLWQCNFGCLDSRSVPSAFLQTNDPNNGSLMTDGAIEGSSLEFDHWYEFRLSIDWTQPGGRATLRYRDLTLGQVPFTTDAALTDISLGLVPSVTGVYTAYYIATRMDQSGTGGTSTIDDLRFDYPPCPADFNCSGSLSVQDIFDFLAAYFGGDPRADANGSGAISVQDIFDFLAAYFGGC